ncbi:MAG: hypothetical protein ACTSW1_19635 [Candidatus Hodarchaeales archaeon]
MSGKIEPTKNSTSTLYLLERLGKSFRFKLFLFIFLVYIAGATLDVTNTNPGSRFMLTKAIAKYGEFTIRPEDRDRYSYLDYSVFNGSIYSDKAPGLSLLAVPIYWISDALGTIMNLDTTENPWIIDDLAKFFIILAVLGLGAFTTVRFYDLLQLLGISHKKANYTAIIFAFGSIFYTYIGTFFSHGITAAFLILAIFYATRFKQQRNMESLLYSSFFVGYSVVCDYVMLFYLPFHILYIFLPIRTDVREIIRNFKQFIISVVAPFVLYMIPIVLCGLLIMLYNFFCFGDPLTTPYSYARFFADNQHFANSMFEGLQVLLVSSHHGLIPFMPIILVSLFGFIPMFKKQPELSALCVAIPTVQILLYSKYFLPTGGLAYGPRHLVAIIPLLIIPLAFIFETDKGETKRSRILYYSMVFFSILLGGLSLLINFAGGWVGVYPPYEGMIDPIWGTSDAKGHLEILFSWLSVIFGSVGSFTLKTFYGGFQLDLIVVSIQLGLKERFSSSLARGDPSLFFAVLLLAFLFNPYFSILDLKKVVKEKYLASKRKIALNNIIKYGFYCEVIIIVLLLLWSGFQFLPFIGTPIRETLLSFWNDFLALEGQLSNLPVVNILLVLIEKIGYFLLMFIPFRYNAFSLDNWFLNTITILVITAIIWLPLELISSKNDHEKSNIKIAIEESSYFNKFLILAKVVTIFYLMTGLYSITFFHNSISWYSEFGYIVYIIIFAIVLDHLALPFFIDLGRSKTNTSEGSDVKAKASTNIENKVFLSEKNWHIVLVTAGVVIFLWKVLTDFINKKGTIDDFLFLKVPENIFNLSEWFTKVEHPVQVYMFVMLLLVVVVIIVPGYARLIKYNVFPRDFQEIKAEKKVLQAILLQGVSLLFFIFLLITTLYSALATVPDKSVLSIHLEEWIIWYAFFLLVSVALLVNQREYNKVVQK